MNLLTDTECCPVDCALHDPTVDDNSIFLGITIFQVCNEEVVAPNSCDSVNNYLGSSTKGDWERLARRNVCGGHSMFIVINKVKWCIDVWHTKLTSFSALRRRVYLQNSISLPLSAV